MKKLRPLLLATLLTLPGACVESVHAFYTDTNSHTAEMRRIVEVNGGR
jgi:hypothetical protein